MILIIAHDADVITPHLQTIAKTILKRLFRVYAHIYHQHFKEIVSLGEEAHLNTSFKHFVYFIQEFELIDKKELAPLQVLITCIPSFTQLHADPSSLPPSSLLPPPKEHMLQDLIDRLTNVTTS